jgi:hypothetical protein
LDNRKGEDWKCMTCGLSYHLAPELMAKEKTYHGPETCGKATIQQRISINTINIVNREKVIGEVFAETLERIVVEWEKISPVKGE